MSTRIVIVTYNWPPRNAIGTHRVYAWARYWAEAGARVTVLTAEKQTFDSPLDLALPTPNGVRVIEVPFGRAASLAGRALTFERIRRLAKVVKAQINRRRAQRLDPRSGWRGAAQPMAAKLAGDADIVVSSYGPEAAHLIAGDMKKCNPSLRWVADYRDLWSQRHYSDMTETARQSMHKKEMESVGQWADLVTTVSDDLLRQLADFLEKPVLRVPNGFDIDEDAVHARLGAPQRMPCSPFRIVYTGMLYDGYRDPRPLLDALDTLYGDGKVHDGEVVVEFYGSRLEPLQRLVHEPAYARFIRIMGHVPHQEALKAQESADLLLLLESPLPEARGVLTGKVFEYIAAGRPILCIGSRPEYEIGNVLAATRTGMVFGPEEYSKLSTVLLATLNGNGVYDLYTPNLHEVMSYSRERLAKGMLSRMLA